MLRVCVAVFLVICAACLGTAEAADAVKTRAATHENYGRIAFDWPAPVAYQAKLDGATLVIHFERPLATRLDQIARYLGSYIASASLDEAGTTLTAALTRPVTLKSFTEGNTIAIDLVDAGKPTTKAAAEKPATKKAAAEKTTADEPPAVAETPAAAEAPAVAEPPVVSAAPAPAASRPLVLVPRRPAAIAAAAPAPPPAAKSDVVV